jgi:pimeloyl-ACP methyl ester carboxylesterase
MTSRPAGEPAFNGVRVGEHDIVLEGIRLHCLEWPHEGGDAVLLLHGGGLSARTWDVVAADLADRYRCYAPDLRGHGDSEWSPTLDYRIGTHARDVERLVHHLEVDRFVLVGHSLGAFTALRFAAAHSHRLAGLVAVDATPFVSDSDQVDRVRRFMLDQTEFTSIDEAVDYAARFQPQRDREGLHESVSRRLRQYPDGRWRWKHDRHYVDADYITSVIKDARALLDEMDKIRCPTLVIRGSDGCPLEDARRFVELLPDGRLETVDRAGHNVHRDNPGAFLNALRSFLRRIT